MTTTMILLISPPILPHNWMYLHLVWQKTINYIIILFCHVMTPCHHYIISCHHIVMSCHHLDVSSLSRRRSRLLACGWIIEYTHCLDHHHHLHLPPAHPHHHPSHHPHHDGKEQSRRVGGDISCNSSYPSYGPSTISFSCRQHPHQHHHCHVHHSGHHMNHQCCHDSTTINQSCILPQLRIHLCSLQSLSLSSQHLVQLKLNHPARGIKKERWAVIHLF